ncbi:hypothetical protein [Cystobacter ferrugineus]|uniref:Uncharacterized protein n=1 Tax=Cystobacter ferrugineus TaxID=83449 RepID=A0A1L9BF59_9BACT|nr:hypothetical protein [Cystobacter ferrugineus]OJH40890.1 hypothetical protein BON30_08180 [Cystobacter ferrugineus]
MLDTHAQIARALASRKVRTTTIALLVAGSLVVNAAPPERFHTAVIGGSTGFTLLFAWLFFHRGIPLLPQKQRGPLILAVLVMLALLLVVQARAVLDLATGVLQSQVLNTRSVR